MYISKTLLFYLSICLTNALNSSLNRAETASYGLINASRINDENKIRLKVFYETLCPASIEFFLTQLWPTVDSLSSYVDVHMVPYGFVQRRDIRGHYLFKCQHGPPECYGNKIHACAIDVINNSTQAVIFNTCLMQYTNYTTQYGVDFTSALNWCGFNHGINTAEIWKCVHSARGSLLLKEYGDETEQRQPHYVPYVVLNDQELTTDNLMSTICHLLTSPPQTCNVFFRKRLNNYTYF